jgi:outer membrane usher protein
VSGSPTRGLSERPSAKRLALLVLSPAFILLTLSRPVGAERESSVPLSLIVNGQEYGVVSTLLRGDDVLVEVDDLERAGLRGFDGRREIVEGRAYLSLNALAPIVIFRIDERAVALNLQVDPRFLTGTRLDLGVPRPAGILYRQDPSVFLNYGLQLIDFERELASLEGGLALDGGLLTSSVTRYPDGRWVRGLTSALYDHRPTLTRYTLGDRPVGLGVLGGSFVLGGLSASREFALDPYVLRSPGFSVSGILPTHASADIYVNGLLARRESLAPGPFALRNLPVPVGSGTIRLVLRDVFGREQVIVNPVYGTVGLLGSGLQDWSYGFGFQRRNLATDSADYHDAVVFGRHRVGLTDWLTAGMRLEGTEAVLSGGPELALRLPVGEARLDAAGSVDEGRTGWAVSTAYTWQAPLLSLGTSLKLVSDSYATASQRATDDRARLEIGAFLGIPLGPRASATVSYALADFRSGGTQERVSTLGNVRLSSRMSLVVGAAYTLSELQAGQSGADRWETFATFTYFLGGSTTASASYHQQGRDRAGEVAVQKSLPVGNGFGYQVRAGAGTDGERGGGQVQYQGPYGRYEASGEHVDGHSTTTLGIAGAIVGIGGRVFMTRPVDDSFAVIRVPGVASVRGYLENQEVGRTASAGDLFVPSVRPFIGNRFRIAEEDLPLDRSVETIDQIVATPFRGGAVVSISAKRLRALSGKILVEEGGRIEVPRFETLVVTSAEGRHESPLGREAEFYLENVPPGRSRAAIEYADGRRCSMPLDVPDVREPITDLGTLRCREVSRPGAP